MDFFTLDRQYNKKDEIDTFISGIWTERYYGDSEVELVVEAKPDVIKKLPVGTFLGEESAKELMMIETSEIEEGVLKLGGISVLPWMNNRFIRSSALHEDKAWSPGTDPVYPGWIIWAILYYWCVAGPYLNEIIDMGIPNPQRFKIPIYLEGYDKSTPKANFTIEYGPVYNAMKNVATTYELGMKITLDRINKKLRFLNYKGRDRTSRQTANSLVRFSADEGSLTEVKELQSIQNLKTLIYSFAPDNVEWTTLPGTAQRSSQTGFDLRALQTFEDITADDMGGWDYAVVIRILNQRAKKALQDNHFVKTVDGRIAPESGFRYGVDFNLGDLVEMEGPSGIITISRVTEYIRAQDASGEKAYPTVVMLE